MPAHPLSLEGPGGFGAKIENRVRMGTRLKSSFSIGIYNGRASGNNSQCAKKIQADLKRKINKSNAIVLQGSVMWFGNNRFTQLGLGHQHSITNGTFLSSKIQYADKENGTINL